MVIDVDALANEIRRVDGSHSLGAGALAEALMPFIERALEPQGQALPELPKLPDWYGAMYDMIRFCVPTHMEEIAMSRLRDAVRPPPPQLALPAEEGGKS